MNVNARLLHLAILRSKPPDHLLQELEEFGLGSWYIHTDPGIWRWDADEIKKMSWVEAKTLYDEMNS